MSEPKQSPNIRESAEEIEELLRQFARNSPPVKEDRLAQVVVSAMQKKAVR